MASINFNFNIMRKIISTLIFFAFFANVNVSAQIKVNSSGQVGMGCNPSTSACWIKSTTTPNFVLEGVSSRLQIGVASSNGSFASFAQATDVVYRPLGGAHHHGLIFLMSNTTNNGNSYIKFGDEANGGWFSIFNNRKVLIDGNVGIGRSASYKLDVNGVIRVEQQVISSDERLKTEIKSLSDEKDKLYLLQGKSYKKTLPPTGIKDIRYNEDGEEYFIEGKKKITEFSEYGYLAQELKEIFPDLVSQDSAGYYAVNYIGLIPIMVEAIKELRTEIDDLKGKAIANISLRSLANETETTGIIDAMIAQCKLYQNTPNPFNQETEIKYYLPEDVKTAYLCIYNLQGTQIKQIPITQRGEDSQWISGSELTAGMYLYALIVDGKEVDTKRMILTK